MYRLIVVILLLPAALALGASSVSLTVYNQDLALVRDVRDIDYKKGPDEILFRDVSGQIDGTSVHFFADGVAMLEQNFDYDLVSSDKLIQKFVDQKIEVMTENGDLIAGTLLTASTYGPGGYVILQQPDGSLRNILSTAITEIRYPQLPEGLITRPTLRWLVTSDNSEKKETEVSYLTSGLNWRADYVLVLDEKSSDRADLSSWVTLNNTCGTSFKSAKLKLMAGDVNRVQEPSRSRYAVAKVMAMDAMAEGGFEEKSFFEYHLYTLQRPTDLLDQQTKQISLFPVTSVNTRRVYEYDWRRKQDKVGVMIEFENRESNGLGMALPGGRVRIYQQDTDGSEEFVGEDNIDHKPKDEKVRVRTGEAFDITPERVEKDRRRITDRIWEVDVEVKIRNHKTESVDVIVVDHYWGDWTVTKSSLDHKKASSTKLEFVVPVAVDGETVLTYTVRNQ